MADLMPPCDVNAVTYRNFVRSGVKCRKQWRCSAFVLLHSKRRWRVSSLPRKTQGKASRTSNLLPLRYRSRRTNSWMNGRPLHLQSRRLTFGDGDPGPASPPVAQAGKPGHDFENSSRLSLITD